MIVNIKDVINLYRTKIREKIKHEKYNIKLLGILSNDDNNAKIYAKFTGRSCKKDGIEFELIEIDKNNIINYIEKVKDDNSIHGIIVYYPIFENEMTFMGITQDNYIRNSIPLNKDVEGLSHFYKNYLYRNVRFIDNNNTKKCILPCTSISIVKILEHLVYKKDTKLQNHIVTIINRSEIVGRPLAMMLSNDGATVYSVDINTIYLLTNDLKYEEIEYVEYENIIGKSDIIITGVPNKKFKLNTDYISPNTFIINFSGYKNIDEEKLKNIEDIKYVPSIGGMTIAMLERNLLRLYENFY